MFDEFISFQARLRPEALALIMPARAVTFADFDRDITRVAAALGDMRVEPDEAVAVAIADGYCQWLMMLALARRRIASAPAHDVACRLRITDRPGEPGESNVVRTPPDWFAKALQAPPKTSAVSPSRPRDGLAHVLRTSGTTGPAKRIGLTWQIAEAIIRNTSVAYGTGQDGRWLALTGAATILGFALSLGAWATGNTVLLLGGRPLNAESISVLRPTLIGMVPFQLRDLLSALPPAFSTPQPLTLVTGGSPLPWTLAQQARSRLTRDIRSVYGTSECGAVAIADAFVLERQPNAAGYLLPGVEVQIVDGTGQPVAPGESGEVRIRSGRTVAGYIADAEQTAAQFRNGWFHPGDVGRLYDDGLLSIEGRIDEQINLGGEKVLPSLIEQEVLRCPGVIDAAAFSVPDRSGLERCWLSVVTNAEFAGERLERCVSEHLPWLRNLLWVTVQSIPRNAMGKIDRNQLRGAAHAFMATDTSTS